MNGFLRWVAIAAVTFACIPAMAQSGSPAIGTVVLLHAESAVTLDNDEAHLAVFVQEQNADRAAAASAVNTKMKEALARAKATDPSAQIKTTGYSTYPTYASSSRQINGWIVRQDASITTRTIANVDKLVAAVQAMANLGGVQFVPSAEALRRAQDQLSDLAFADLRERIVRTARGLGRSPGDAVIEEVDLSGQRTPPVPRPMVANARMAAAEVAEPRLEAGDSQATFGMNVRVRFR